MSVQEKDTDTHRTDRNKTSSNVSSSQTQNHTRASDKPQSKHITAQYQFMPWGSLSRTFLHSILCGEIPSNTISSKSQHVAKPATQYVGALAGGQMKCALTDFRCSPNEASRQRCELMKEMIAEERRNVVQSVESTTGTNYHPTDPVSIKAQLPQEGMGVFPTIYNLDKNQHDSMRIENIIQMLEKLCQKKTFHADTSPDLLAPRSIIILRPTHTGIHQEFQRQVSSYLSGIGDKLLSDNREESLIKAEQLLLLSIYPNMPIEEYPMAPVDQEDWAEPGSHLILSIPPQDTSKDNILPRIQCGTLQRRLLSEYSSSYGHQAASFTTPRLLRNLMVPIDAMTQR